MPISSGSHGRVVWPGPSIIARICVYGRRMPEPPSFGSPSRGSIAMLAVFSVIPYELRTRTPEICSNRLRIGIGIAVEPVTKYGFSDDRFSFCGGDFVSNARVVGTPDRRVTRYFSTSLQ